LARIWHGRGLLGGVQPFAFYNWPGQINNRSGACFDGVVPHATLEFSAEMLPKVASDQGRGGRVAEGGGLLILPALFVLTDFHVFCLRLATSYLH